MALTFILACSDKKGPSPQAHAATKSIRAVFPNYGDPALLSLSELPQGYYELSKVKVSVENPDKAIDLSFDYDSNKDLFENARCEVRRGKLIAGSSKLNSFGFEVSFVMASEPVNLQSRYLEIQLSSVAETKCKAEIKNTDFGRGIYKIIHALSTNAFTREGKVYALRDTVYTRSLNFKVSLLEAEKNKRYSFLTHFDAKNFGITIAQDYQLKLY